MRGDRGDSGWRECEGRQDGTLKKSRKNCIPFFFFFFFFY